MDEEDDEEANIDSNDDLESISACSSGVDSDSDKEAPKATNAEDSDEDDSSIRTFTIAHLNAANAGGGFGNTKIKMENLSFYTTVKIKNSNGTKDSGAQGTDRQVPQLRLGAQCPESLLKKTPWRSSLRTLRPMELIAP